MRAYIIQSGAAALLFLGVLVILPIQAEALPIGGHPDKCKGGVPDGAFSCANSGGTVACTNDGDYMCCKKNTDGGQDCEQIASFKTPKGSVGQIPGGQLQVAPTNPVPKTSPFQKGGTNEPIMRRGVEGEGSGSSPTGQEEKATAPK